MTIRLMAAIVFVLATAFLTLAGLKLWDWFTEANQQYEEKVAQCEQAGGIYLTSRSMESACVAPHRVGEPE